MLADYHHFILSLVCVLLKGSTLLSQVAAPKPHKNCPGSCRWRRSFELPTQKQRMGEHLTVLICPKFHSMPQKRTFLSTSFYYNVLGVTGRKGNCRSAVRGL